MTTSAITIIWLCIEAFLLLVLLFNEEKHLLEKDDKTWY